MILMVMVLLENGRSQHNTAFCGVLHIYYDRAFMGEKIVGRDICFVGGGFFCGVWVGVLEVWGMEGYKLRW